MRKKISKSLSRLIIVVFLSAYAISWGTINTIIENQAITKEQTTSNIGLLVGKSEGGVIENSHASGTITITGDIKNTNVGLIGSSKNTKINNVTGNIHVVSTSILEKYGGVVSFILSILASIIAALIQEIYIKFNSSLN